MGRCVRCGMPMPGNVYGATCLNCQREEQSKRAREAQEAREAKEKEKREAQKARAAEEKRTSTVKYWNDADGNLVQEYADGSRTVTTQGEIRRGFWGTIALILVAVVAIGFVLVKFVFTPSSIESSFNGEGAENLVVTAPLGEEENTLLTQIRTIVKDAKEYELRVTQSEPNWFVKDKVAVTRYFVDDKFGEGFTVVFKGLTSDTGLKGEYTLMKYDGKICVFCDDDETIYPPDSEFYKTHYEALAKWNGKTMFTALLDKIQTGEVFEKYTDMFVLKSDKLSVFIAQDGSVQLLDETGEKSKLYTFTPKNTDKPENYADYKPMGYEDEETDELQKILNKADYDATVKWFVNGESKGEMRVIDNGDGSYTFENGYNPTDKIATGKYILYPEEKRYDYYAYKNEFTLSDTAEKHTEKDSSDTYKWFSDLIPENYVKAHLNLDNAKKKSVLGLETTYTEDFGNGKKSVLEVEIGGKMSFEYHESEETYVEIDW